MKRTYKYRILKDKKFTSFYVEKKPQGLLGFFEPWITIKAFYELNEAKKFCIDMIAIQDRNEPEIKVIEVFK